MLARLLFVLASLFLPTFGEDTPIDATLISAIQGAAEESSLVGQEVTISAVVIGDFSDDDDDMTRNLGGFFVQEEDSDADSDPLTSEGIFVFDGNVEGAGVDVELGNLVQVTGEVEERFGQTQLAATAIQILNASVPIPTPAIVSFPLDSSSSLEAYEGMGVQIERTMVIVEMFNLDRFNEVVVFNNGRPYQYTQWNPPSVSGYEAHVQDYLELNRITYDDGLNSQNENIGLLDGFSNYSTSTAWRMGDSIDKMQGVLTYSFDKWRIRSVVDGSNVFLRTNPRPETPPTIDGDLKITSFNVLNFFVSLDLDESSATVGPTGDLEPRGADSEEEFDRQLAKLVTVFALLDLDIVAVVELENEFSSTDDSTALETLVAAINAELGETVYEAVYPGAPYVDASDAISVGFFYKTSTVTLKGLPAILNDTTLQEIGSTADLPVFDGPSTNRAALAASFEHNGECITIANNHFKSKGGSGEGLNADLGDGAGNWNYRRLQAAKAVDDWLKTDPTGGTCSYSAIVGDLNAYAMEDPIQYLVKEAGYINVESPEAFSYVFDGQLGTLDYILVSSNVTVVDAAVWHISEDEADALDYNLDFGRSADYFQASSPARPSDHSPVLVGLDLSTPRVVDAPTDESGTERVHTRACPFLLCVIAALRLCSIL